MPNFRLLLWLPFPSLTLWAAQTGESWRRNSSSFSPTLFRLHLVSFASEWEVNKTELGGGKKEKSNFVIDHPEPRVSKEQSTLANGPPRRRRATKYQLDSRSLPVSMLSVVISELWAEKLPLPRCQLVGLGQVLSCRARERANGQRLAGDGCAHCALLLCHDGNFRQLACQNCACQADELPHHYQNHVLADSSCRWLN